MFGFFDKFYRRIPYEKSLGHVVLNFGNRIVIFIINRYETDCDTYSFLRSQKLLAEINCKL